MTLNDVKINVAVNSLIGNWSSHGITDTVSLLAENLCLNFYCFSFSTYIRFFVRVLRNVHISNELNFSDVY